MSGAIRKICDVLIGNVHVALSILLHALISVVLVVQIHPVGHAQLQYKQRNIHAQAPDSHTSVATLEKSAAQGVENTTQRPRRKRVRPPHSIRPASDNFQQAIIDPRALLPKYKVRSAVSPKHVIPHEKPVHSPISNAKYGRSSLTKKEMNLLSSRLSNCWSILSDAAHSSKAVKVNLALDIHGHVLAVTVPDMHIYNSDPVFRAVADSALRAVRKCSPFTELQNVSYDTWKEIELTFDPTPL